jgi:hypothetical protein
MTTTPPPTLIPWEGFNPDHPGRLAPGCRQIAELLNDNDWRPWSAIVDTVAEALDLTPKTVDNLLCGMVRLGSIKRRGNHRSRCTRSVRRVAER